MSDETSAKTKKGEAKPGQGMKLPGFMQLLSPEQRAIVDSHLLADSPADGLLEIIQGKWGMCTNMSKDALRRAVYRYKDRFILPKQATVVAKLTSNEMVTRLAASQKQMDQVLNPVNALESLISLQLSRVEKLKETEGKMPTLLDSQTKNITALGDMLFKLAALHLDVGLLRKVPQKHNVTMTAEQQAFVSSLEVTDTVNKAKMNVLAMLESQGVLSRASGVQSIADEERTEPRREGDDGDDA